MSATPSLRTTRRRLFRDPVHNIISFRDEGLLGALVCALIDTREFQRLRHIRQLGMASLVFHGAEHSRFAHSIGVAHIARTFADRAAPNAPEHDRAAVVAAALLHDLGHAPFSHVMERVFGFHHESFSEAIVLDPDTQVNRVLREVDEQFPSRVADILTGRAGGYASDIVSSQLDADRCDYLLRDAHMTGIEVGRYDLARITTMLEHDETGLFVDVRAFESIEGYLIARYHMYRLVYFHRAVRAAEAMLQRLFAQARRLIEQGDRQVGGADALGSLMRGESVSATAYADVGDYDAWALVSRWRSHGDPILGRLARDLMERRLLRTSERTAGDDGTFADDDALLALIEEQLSPAERMLFFVDEARDTPYRPYQPHLRPTDRPIRIRDRNGKIFHIEERSPVVRALAEASYRMRRWYFAADLRPKLRRITGADL